MFPQLLSFTDALKLSNQMNTLSCDALFMRFGSVKYDDAWFGKFFYPSSIES
jgi:hypothetical protein